MKLLCRILAVSMLFCSVYSTNADEYGHIFRRKSNSQNKIALTFDDGPHPEKTLKILNLLEKYGVSATFFTVGENVRMYPDIVEYEILHGHEVGNHTDSHPHMKAQTADTLICQLQNCEDSIFTATDTLPKLFRPPEGVINRPVQIAAEKLGYTVILWDIDTRDWAHTKTDDICRNVLTNIKSGDIILMHDYISGESHTYEALEIIIPKLLERGFVFVTVSELLGSE